MIDELWFLWRDQVCVALTMGTLFLQARISEKGARQRVSFISFTLALLIFTSVEAMGIFLEERQIFIRETSRGAYRAATYVISGAIVIIPFLMILAIVFSTISYWLVGLVAEPGPFFFFTLTVFLVLLVANSFVSFVSGLVPNFTVGNSLCSAVIAYFFLFSGFFIERYIPSIQLTTYSVALRILHPHLIKFPLHAARDSLRLLIALKLD